MLLVLNTKPEDLRKARLAGQVSLPDQLQHLEIKGSQLCNLASSSALSAGKTNLAPD